VIRGAWSSKSPQSVHASEDTTVALRRMSCTVAHELHCRDRDSGLEIDTGDTLMATHSTWQNFGIASYPRLTENRTFDVVVVGGGITGLTAAYFLKLAGKTVCVLERDRLADVDTGHTTAHLTYVTDLRLNELARRFGKEAARLVWSGGAAAIETIESIADGESIDCEFRRVPGFLHAALGGEQDESDGLQQDYELAREFGFHASFVDSVPLIDKPGIRFSNQAKFHPRKYCAGLAQAIDGDGSAIFEQAEVTEATDNQQAVKVGGYDVRCQDLIIATHVPLMGKTGLVSATVMQSKLAPYSSYVIQARIPRGRVPEACFWDTSDPYHYLRVDAGEAADAGDRVIFGGEDHKTGQADDTDERFRRLTETLHTLLPEALVEQRWSGQVIATNDDLPYVGPTAERQYVATGFGGTGMTFGTLGAMILCDRILGNDNPWADLLDVNRKTLRGGAWNYLTENFDFPYYLVKDFFTPAEGQATSDVQRGEGKIIKLDGNLVACSRDERGELHMVSATCTHMGCRVGWNAAEKTWDCPCHGSRFHADGQVLAGPAETPLAPVAQAKATAR
jgi:glycine/D-amino acid oxidase-like deaminating enzyme/nitrite reductase/ring-hydroxylating ferredoxin subunit